MAICLRASEGNLAATEWGEGIGIEIKLNPPVFLTKKPSSTLINNKNCYPVLNQA
jgi:hypothetical protein